MDITNIKEMNEELQDEINKEINKMTQKINTNNLEEALILQDKLINLLLILKKENEKPF